MPISQMEFEIKQIPEVLGRLFMGQQQFETAVARIKSSSIKSVMIAARGTSDNAAHYLKHLIEVELGIPVGLASPSVVSIYGAKLHYSETLVIALSQSGQSPDLVAFVKAARDGGALTLGITNDANSTLAKSVELHLDLLADREIAVAATKSYTAQLFASLCLVNHWKGLASSFDGLTAEATRILGALDGLDDVLKSLDAKCPIVALGRGFSYGNARELALKIQETSHIPVQGMSTADYLHGPIAAVDEETRVLILAPNGTSRDGLKEAISKLRTITKHLIWIGDSSWEIDGELSLQGSKIGSEQISTVLDSILLQIIACKFAIKNGFNPDSPKGLTKVTLTT